MRQLSHAEDRADAGGRHGPQPHIQVHRAGRGGAPEDAGRLYDVPHGQDARLGDGRVEDLAGVLAVASRRSLKSPLGGVLDLSKVAGLQSRFRWILQPGNDLFLILNRGGRRTLDDSRFEPIFDRASAKLQYTMRF